MIEDTERERRMRYLAVIRTIPLLNDFIKTCEEQPNIDSYHLQCEKLCVPFIESFPTITSEFLHYELLNQGLFNPDEWKLISKWVKEMETRNIWHIVDREYQFLRRIWNGPSVSIFVLPIKRVDVKRGQQKTNRNGVAFRGNIFLFLSADLTIGELKALIAHEYNHVCRLNFLGLAPDEIPLKDSLIIEGLGEYAVKSLYGDSWLAPWTNLYSFQDTIRIWKRHFLPSLNLLGTGNHHIYLFGKSTSPLSIWIGYQLGFQIVTTFDNNHGPFNMQELYSKSSDEIISGSDFSFPPKGQ